jgi:hypothetical protein
MVATRVAARRTAETCCRACAPGARADPPVRTLRSAAGSALIEGSDAQPTGHAEHDGYAERRRPMA